MIDPLITAPAVHAALHPFKLVVNAYESMPGVIRPADASPLRNCLAQNNPTLGELRKLVNVLEQLFGMVPEK